MNEQDAPQGHPDPGRWWKHRRKGYYIGIGWGVLQTFGWIVLGAVNSSVMDSMGVVIGWSYGLSCTLILGYYGNTAMEELAKKGGINRD